MQNRLGRPEHLRVHRHKYLRTLLYGRSRRFAPQEESDHELAAIYAHSRTGNEARLFRDQKNYNASDFFWFP